MFRMYCIAAVEYNALYDFKHNMSRIFCILQELCDDLVQYVCLGCTVLQLLSTIPYVQDVQYVVYYA